MHLHSKHWDPSESFPEMAPGQWHELGTRGADWGAECGLTMLNKAQGAGRGGGVATGGQMQLLRSLPAGPGGPSRSC